MNCIRCRKPIEDGQAAIEMEPARFGVAHLACEVEAARRHVFYYRFFLVTAVLVVAVLTFAVVSDIASGHKAVWNDIKCLGPALFSIALLPLLIRGMVVPWAQRVEQAEAEEQRKREG